MILFNKDRAKQLENRLLKLRINHDKFHHKCFKSENPIYKQIQNKRRKFVQDNKRENEKVHEVIQRLQSKIPPDWETSKENCYLTRSNRIMSKIQNELLAINYYNAVRNCNYTFRMISNVKDTINKYDYAGFGHGAIEIDNLFPQSQEEIAKKEKLKNATFLEKLDMKESNYHLNSKKANLECHELVKKVCKLIFSDRKTNKERIEEIVERRIEEISKIESIVKDRESLNVIESIINRALKESDYSFRISIC